MNINLKTTSVFKKNLEADTKYVFNCGGSRSSKTYSLMQIAYLIALLNDNITISVVSESYPHLRRGAMKDFFDFLKHSKLYQERFHNKSNSSYTVNKSVIEFFGVNESSKVHGAGRDYLFANEIQNLSYETFFQLSMRTNKTIYADYNPVDRFWVYEKYIENPEYKDDLTFIHSTVFDNEFVSESIKQDIIKRAKNDENFRQVYLEGKPGVLEGLIFKDFKIVDEVPLDFDLISYGLDFGYTNDPSTCIAVYKRGNDLLFKQIFYTTGLLNSDIILKLKNEDLHTNYSCVYADCAEPKSIDEIHNAGINVYPCTKGKDSIIHGINLLKQFNLFVTEDSLELISELRKYTWLVDKNGKALNRPIDKYNHAIDAIRYAVATKLTEHSNTTVDIW